MFFLNKIKMSKIPKRIPLITLVITLLFLAGSRAQSQSPSPYLILYAFSAEGQLLKEKMSILDSSKALGRSVYVGKLSGKDIVLAESGVGMTNAAMTVQKLIDKYHPKRVIFTGIAGAIDSTVHIGDIVVCQNWVTHDYVYHGAEGPQPRGIRIYLPQTDSLVRKLHFMVDSTMFSNAKGLSKNVIPFKKVGERTPKLLIGDVGVSGNAFIDNHEKRIWLSDNFEALITDMESAAVAQVCMVNDIPFIIFRSASDLAGGSGSSSARDELDQFFKIAAENSSMLVIKFLEYM